MPFPVGKESVVQASRRGTQPVVEVVFRSHPHKANDNGISRHLFAKLMNELVLDPLKMTFSTYAANLQTPWWISLSEQVSTFSTSCESRMKLPYGAPHGAVLYVPTSRRYPKGSCLLALQPVDCLVRQFGLYEEPDFHLLRDSLKVLEHL